MGLYVIPKPLLEILAHGQLRRFREGPGINLTEQFRQPALRLRLGSRDSLGVVPLLTRHWVGTEINLDCPGILPHLGPLSDTAAGHNSQSPAHPQNFLNRLRMAGGNHLQIHRAVVGNRPIFKM